MFATYFDGAAPVRPGDRLSLVGECIEKTPSERKPDRGVMCFRHDVSTSTAKPS